MRIFGLDEIRKGSPEYEPPETLPAFECVLAHNPDTVPQSLTTGMLRGIDLILCGHTHGGQIRIFSMGVAGAGGKLFPKYDKGIYDGRMVVSAGCSNTAAIPRINNPRELVIIHLKKR